MKIGVFSDVHGHLDELRKTLTLFETLKVDQIICAGDLVDKGQYSDSVIALMHERKILCVQGNHDAKANFLWFMYREPLLEKSLEYLERLPKCLTFEWAGNKVYLCHANPWEDSSIYIFPDRPESLFKLLVESVDADIIIIGHTHHPMRIEFDGRLILNPGSIYGNRDRAERTCGILTLPERTFDLYNIDTGQKL